ncbi:hypothetical protein CY35_07G067700 [Sphagnum magellanicum]|uniref:Uncharacterized protein n=1 Tax=Sphagnum magellanicum TaxID=128215 RepID=A0ACB8HLN9_9BRYO|nr:hypothetical protein CY35_07G067700 [Sphagnum magellanicum]
MAVFLCAFVSGSGFYRHKRPMGSPLSRIAQVFVASVCKWRLEVPADSQLLFEIRDKESVVPGSRRIPHSNSFRFLDKAAILEPLQQQPEELDARAAAAAATSCKEIIIRSSPWRLSTVTQVEEVKLVLRLLPIWVAALLFATLPAQISTFYTRQGTTLDINLGPNFQIPAASLQSLIPITIVTLIPLYDRVFVPVVRHFTGNVRGITMLQRIGIGIFISILSMVAAAITEIKRVKVAKEHGLLDQPNSTIPMSVFVLLPQYVLLGTAEVFTSIGALEFFYDQAPDSMRSLGTALFLSTIGVGNFLSSLLLTAIVEMTRLSGGHHHPPHQSGWIVDNLNRCRLDYFYWLLAGLSGLNLCFFMSLAHWYSYKKINKTTDF